MSTPVIGIVGGVGAGKSSVVKRVRNFRLLIIDADQIGHQQLAVESVRNALVGSFGNSILNQEGQINRAALAAFVFGKDPTPLKKRDQLNSIVHPRIRAEIRRQIEAIPQDVDAIVLDAALLLESGLATECDAIVFMDTPIEHRQQRVLENRNWSPEELRRREESQWTIEKKREFAQYTVNNSGTVEDAAKEMSEIFREVIEAKKQ